jgi:hypothetical protein
MPPYEATLVPLSNPSMKLFGARAFAVLLVNRLVANCCEVTAYTSFMRALSVLMTVSLDDCSTRSPK